MSKAFHLRSKKFFLALSGGGESPPSPPHGSIPVRKATASLCVFVSRTSNSILTSCYCNGSDKPHRRRGADRAIVFSWWRQCTHPSGAWFLGSTPICTNGISIGSAVLAGLTGWNRQTDRQTDTEINERATLVE